MNRFFWLVIAIAGCQGWAQTGAPTPEQINAKLLEDLRGDSIEHPCNPGKGPPEEICTGEAYTVAPQKRPHQQSVGQTVSVKQLRHKIPKEAAKEFQRALKLSKAGEHEKAISQLEAALSRDPELASAVNRLGIEYGYLQSWEAAEIAFRRTIDLEPAWWMGHYNLALVLFVMRDSARAEASLRRALALSDNPKIHLMLGELLVKRQETQTEGISELRVASHKIPEAKRILRSLGVL